MRRPRLWLLLLLVLLWPALAQATILIPEDGFETELPSIGHGSTSIGDQAWGWGSGYCAWSPSSFPCPYLDLSTDVAHAGARSLKGTYSAAWGDPNPQINTQSIYKNYASVTEQYVRYWHYTAPTFTYNSNETKSIYHKGSGLPNGVSAYYQGSRNLTFAVQGIEGACPPGSSGGSGTCFLPTIATVNQNDSTWYCIVEHYKLGTPGNADAKVEIWVNGTQTVNATFQALPASGTGVNGGTANATLNELSIYKQNGDGAAYYDQFIAGTTRADVDNCPGSVIDTTPPSQVTGVTVTGTTNTTASVTIEGASDAESGIAAYRYELCAGVGCSAFSLWATTGNGLTTSLTGLTANTTYNLRVNARNGANLLGAYSTTVPFTTTNTADVTRLTTGTDTFNRADGDLGASWDHGYTTFIDGQIVSNAVEPVALGTFAVETLNTAVANDQWIEGTIGAFTGAINQKLRMLLRVSAPGTATLYGCEAARNVTNKSRIFKYDGATQTDYAVGTTETWANGDRMRCEIQGNTLSLYQNDVLDLSHVTDGAYTAGRVGMALQTSAGGALTDSTFDAVSWGEWGVVAAPVIVDAVTDTTGSTLTYGTTTPTFVRVQTDTTNDVLAIAAIPAGRYTRPGGGWATGLTFVCFFAQDVNHTESGVETDHQCDNLAGLTIPADTTPPVLSAPAPSGTLAAGTTSTTISMTSDEVADLKYSTTDVAYASMASSMTTVDGLHHSATVTGLTDGSTNTYYVRGQDRSTALNVNLTSSLITFQVSIAADTIPPILSAGSPTGTLAAGTTSVTMSVNTNENATCKYSTTAGVAYASMATTFTTGNGTQAHSTTVGSLVNGTTYTRYIRCIDGATNANTSDYLITWTIANPPVDTTPPVLSGGSPSGQLPAGTTSVSMQVNTNEAATCKYNTVAGRAWTHASSVLFTTTGGTAHSTTISGLSNGNTYLRYIRCRDVALNMNTSDYVITWSIANPPAPDTTPPVRSGGSPSGALPSGTTAVVMQLTTNETATCKFGTAASTAYASIANTFSTTGGTTHSQPISGLSDGTTLTFYVRCLDVAGNANTNDYTIAWTITAAADVTPPIRSGGSPNGTAFPSGTVTVSMQLSTNESATCKYSATSSVAYGSMVSTFTTTGGTAHSVTIGVSNGTSYTFYVRCQDVAANPNTDDYPITWSVASAPAPDTTPPVLTLGGPTGTLPTTTTAVTLTVTSDEAATCKYGTAASTAYASIANTFTSTGGTLHTQTLSVSANTTYTEYIRCADVLNNANTVDYVITWFVAPAPDVTPAVLTNGAPTGTLPTFTTSVTLQVTTSEPATCKYGTTPGTAYAAIANTFTTTGTTSHAQTIGSLSADTTYTEYVRCEDANGNANVVDYVITWYIDAAPDVTPPVRLDGSPSGVQTLGTTSVSMGLTTDENATCKYGTVAGTSYANLPNTFGTTGTTSHSQTIGSLVNGQVSIYYVRCRDVALNTNTTDFVITWSVAHDVTAPTRSAGLPSGVKATGTTSVSMTLTTDENATCKYGLSPNVAYAAIANTFTTTGTTSHSQTIGGLTDGLISTYFIRCQDASLDANANTTDYTITWSVAATVDTTAPTAPTSVTCTGLTNTQANCTFTPGTDAVGVTSHTVTLGVSSGGTCTPSSLVTTTWGATSPQTLTNLSAGVAYCATLQSRDQAGNLSAASAQTNWTQPPVTDPIFPTDVTGLSLLSNGLFATQVTLIWSASTHPNGISSYDTYRCVGGSCTAFDVHFSTPANAFTDTSVSPSTTYRYETFAVAPSGNVSVNPSNILTVTTPALSPTQPSSLVCPCESH